MLKVLSLILGISLFFNAYAEEFVIERSYSTTFVKTNKNCTLAKYKKICLGYINFLAGRFENSQLQRFNADIDYEDNLAIIDIPHATQKLSVDFRPVSKINLITIITHVETEDVLGKDNFIETVNFNEETVKMISFKDLFEKPQVASLLCARKLEEKFARNNTELFPLVVASIEVNPSRFLILPDGIEFVFPPNLVEKSNQDSVLTVKAEELIEAGPKLEWFPEFKSRNAASMVDPILGEKE